MQVTVVRRGQRQEISTFDLLVGDILLFGYGDILPVDGVLVEGNCIRYASLFMYEHIKPVSLIVKDWDLSQSFCSLNYKLA